MFGKRTRIETTGVAPARVALATGAGLVTVGIAAETATSVALVGGAFVAAGLLTGPAAPLGGVAGLVLHDLFRGAVGYSTLAAAAWILAFAGALVWLTEPVSNASGGVGPRSIRRPSPIDIGTVAIAGIHATAFAGWVAVVLGWQRFYAAAIGFLPGVAVAVGFCVVVLVAVDAVRRLGPLAGRNRVLDFPPFEPGTGERDRSARRTGAPVVGAFTVGVVWLAGTTALDVFVHDLGLFGTTSQFRAFVAAFLGTGSPIATVGTLLLVGVYRYGELAVLLSAPVAVLALWGWQSYRDLIRSSVIHGIKTIRGGPTR